MIIRNRLTWIISITAVIAIAALSLIVYLFTARFHEQEFFTRLEERVSVTELMLLEKNQDIEQAIIDQFLHTLDGEEEYAISLRPSGMDSLRSMFPQHVTEKIRNMQTVRFWQDNRQGIAKYYQSGAREYVVVVTAIDVFGQSKLDFLKRILLIGGLIAVLLLVIVDRIGIAKALKPLENKIQRASRISAKRMDLRLHVKNPDDEIGKVAIAFNRMLDRLQNSFEAQRQFVRHASHEMRNPLTAISGEAEVLLHKDRSPEEYQEALKIIQREADRLQVLIGQLLDLEKTDALSDIPDPELFSIDQCLLETVEQFPSHRMKLEFDLNGNEHNLYGNRHLIRTALQNLIDNALKYSDEKPVTVAFARKNFYYEIKISDKGIGIPEEDLKKIFQPFFRSLNARGKKGHGIGLALVKKIISLHRGGIQYVSTENEGTTVALKLPTSD